jgi:hypothetical protein
MSNRGKFKKLLIKMDAEGRGRGLSKGIIIELSWRN